MKALILNNAIMILVSSPSKDPLHWTWRLIKENPPFLLNRPFVLICPACQQLTSLQEMIKCTHVYDRGSRMQNINKRKELAGSNFDKKDTIRETFALDIPDATNLYSDRLVDLVFKNPVTSKEGIQMLVMYGDPNAYGRCNSALCVVAVINNIYTIVAIDAKNTISDEEFIEFYLQNILKCSKQFRSNVRTIPFFIGIESNGNRTGGFIKREILRDFNNAHFINVIVIGDNQNHEKIGINLNGDRPAQMCSFTRALMSNGSLKMHAEATTMNTDGIKAMEEQLKNEFSYFKSYDRGESKNIDQEGERKKQRPRYSGKDHGQQDDLVISAQGSAFLYDHIRTHKYYEHYMKDFGIYDDLMDMSIKKN